MLPQNCVICAKRILSSRQAYKLSQSGQKLPSLLMRPQNFVCLYIVHRSSLLDCADATMGLMPYEVREAPDQLAYLCSLVRSS
ncbi:hypothetical protein DPMN_191807 [Dreissena polymorpha]|uniref:Uncharacterized protein n=1 Tax=Dreissena polymorpha TaxID=45954 RepID=A0A9D3XXM4_DREPO|nr:hypothetical protein DPMN_191807 [Dreissena polymorpha]